MIDRVTDLQARVQSARGALEGLAERAARLRARLETLPEAVAAPAPSPPAPARGEPPGTTLVSPEVAAGPASALASSLERLTQDAWVTMNTTAPEGDDGRFVSDAWEIALISEEGK
jgi:hypothetical protein